MKKFTLLIITFYQQHISPYLGIMCRHEPTCSNYAYQAILKHGVITGSLMAVTRLFNCRPFGKTGYDPVP
ncbi:MAG: membrane protein insertion efficiency factor YidD [Dehalococcoidia bacterium]|nr:membrane protein insertion efficiency factor YidD [Dehalococcoidia bacterium]MQG16004.1 membrane protein insertion efficiency factor YidD [SAR202 cluster bacterium]